MISAYDAYRISSQKISSTPILAKCDKAIRNAMTYNFFECIVRERYTSDSAIDDAIAELESAGFEVQKEVNTNLYKDTIVGTVVLYISWRKNKEENKQ